MKFKHHDQPYGTKEMKDCVVTPITVETHGDHSSVRHCEAAGLFTVSGIIEKGGTLNRLFQHTSFTDMTGQKHSVWAVSQADLDRGYKTTVAM